MPPRLRVAWIRANTLPRFATALSRVRRQASMGHQRSSSMDATLAAISRTTRSRRLLTTSYYAQGSKADVPCVSGSESQVSGCGGKNNEVRQTLSFSFFDVERCCETPVAADEVRILP